MNIHCIFIHWLGRPADVRCASQRAEFCNRQVAQKFSDEFVHYASRLYAPENEYLYMNIYAALMNKYFFQKPIDIQSKSGIIETSKEKEIHRND